jgi:hypothetical protein
MITPLQTLVFGVAIFRQFKVVSQVDRDGYDCRGTSLDATPSRSQALRQRTRRWNSRARSLTPPKCNATSSRTDQTQRRVHVRQLGLEVGSDSAPDEHWMNDTICFAVWIDSKMVTGPTIVSRLTITIRLDGVPLTTSQSHSLETIIWSPEHSMVQKYARASRMSMRSHLNPSQCR